MVAVGQLIEVVMESGYDLRVWLIEAPAKFPLALPDKNHEIPRVFFLNGKGSYPRHNILRELGSRERTV